MSVYVNPPYRGRWHGKSDRKIIGPALHGHDLGVRLIRVMRLIDENEEIDDEMHYALMKQASTYESFLTHVSNKTLQDDDQSTLRTTTALIEDFCKLIETEMGQSITAGT